MNSLLKYSVLAVGVLLLLVAIFTTYRAINYTQNAVTTTGRVIGFAEFMDLEAEGGIMYAPVILFKTADGNEIELEANSRSSSPEYEVGEEVEILYLPSDPSNATISSFFSIWGVSTIFALIGVIFTIAGVFVARSQGS